MIPGGLRKWFIIHCIIDLVFAIPLFVNPVFTLSLLGWEVVEPIASRLVAAALFGIGLESALCRDSHADVYKHMLNLKLIWSAFAITGLVIAIIQGGSILVWGLLCVFVIFFCIWLKYRMMIDKET